MRGRRDGTVRQRFAQRGKRYKTMLLATARNSLWGENFMRRGLVTNRIRGNGE